MKRSLIQLSFPLRSLPFPGLTPALKGPSSLLCPKAWHGHRVLRCSNTKNANEESMKMVVQALSLELSRDTEWVDLHKERYSCFYWEGRRERKRKEGEKGRRDNRRKEGREGGEIPGDLRGTSKES